MSEESTHPRSRGHSLNNTLSVSLLIFCARCLSMLPHASLASQMRHSDVTLVSVQTKRMADNPRCAWNGAISDFRDHMTHRHKPSSPPPFPFPSATMSTPFLLFSTSSTVLRGSTSLYNQRASHPSSNAHCRFSPLL
jgi:hypothetical protein